MKSLFITGASGFVGSLLIERIPLEKFRKVHLLYRKETESIRRLSSHSSVNPIRGSLFDTSTYSAHLKESDIVLHLAAATGKMKPNTFFRINTEGTRILIEQCGKLKNFLYVSSIAAKFQDQKRYYYAQSKRRAEDTVKGSGLRYLIVRPTIILGRGSPIWKAVSDSSKGLLLPIIGNGKTLIQPIFIDDFVRFLLDIIDKDIFTNETVEIGGPDVVNWEGLQRDIQDRRRNGKSFVFHVPLKPLLAGVGVLERWFYPVLPFTIGQLASFHNDGTARSSTLVRVRSGGMMRLGEMLQTLVTEERESKKFETLVRECKIFCRYLIDQEPDGYVLTKYGQAHGQAVISTGTRETRMDDLLCRISTLHPWITRIVDSYCSVFLKKSILKRKLILLVAILESCAPFYRHFEKGDFQNRYGFYMSMIKNSLFFPAAFSISLLLIAPLHILVSVLRRTSVSREEA